MLDQSCKFSRQSYCGAGIALRVPTPNVSVVDLVIQTEKKTFAEEVNEAFREYAKGQGDVSFHPFGIFLFWLFLFGATQTPLLLCVLLAGGHSLCTCVAQTWHKIASALHSLLCCEHCGWSGLCWYQLMCRVSADASLLPAPMFVFIDTLLARNKAL